MRAHCVLSLLERLVDEDELPGVELLAWGMEELAEEAAEIVAPLPGDKVQFFPRPATAVQGILYLPTLVTLFVEDEGKELNSPLLPEQIRLVHHDDAEKRKRGRRARAPWACGASQAPGTQRNSLTLDLTIVASMTPKSCVQAAAEP